MLVNYSVRFQGQNNSFYTESVSVTVATEDINVTAKEARQNRPALEADLTYQAAKGCFQAVVLAGGMDAATAKHRLKPFRRMRDKMCYGETGEKAKTDTPRD